MALSRMIRRGAPLLIAGAGAVWVRERMKSAQAPVMQAAPPPPVEDEPRAPTGRFVREDPSEPAADEAATVEIGAMVTATQPPPEPEAETETEPEPEPEPEEGPPPVPMPSTASVNDVVDDLLLGRSAASEEEPIEDATVVDEPSEGPPPVPRWEGDE